MSRRPPPFTPVDTPFLVVVTALLCLGLLYLLFALPTLPS